MFEIKVGKLIIDQYFLKVAKLSRSRVLTFVFFLRGIYFPVEIFSESIINICLKTETLEAHLHGTNASQISPSL